MIETLEYSSKLIETYGRSHLPNGLTLSETLTIDGIPLWDVFAVELARIYVPAAIFPNRKSSNIPPILRSRLIRTKYNLQHLLRNRYTKKGCFSWPTGKTILCLDFSEHISRDVVQPIVTRLTQNPDVNVVSLSDKAWGKDIKYLHPKGVYHTVWDHWDQQFAMSVVKFKKDIRKIVKYLYASNVLMNIIGNENALLWNQLESVFHRFLNADLPLLAPQALVAKHILDNHRPDLIISSDVADPRTRVYTLLCAQRGIPCIEVQFGLVGEEGIEWRFFSADNLVVWGESSKHAMLKHGIPEEKIIITGSPRHDALFNVTDSEVMSKRTLLGVPATSKVILLASAYQLNAYNDYSNPELLSSMKRGVFEAADNTNGIILVVKPHPSENVRETKELAKKYKNIVFVSSKSDIRELTRICDAFISFGSTSTADALIARKLVICPVFPGWIWSDLFKNSGATLLPTSTSEIKKIFKIIASGDLQEELRRTIESSRQTFLSQWVYKTDGLATQRVAEVALSMAKVL